MLRNTWVAPREKRRKVREKKRDRLKEFSAVVKSKKYNWTLLSLEFLIIPSLFLRGSKILARDTIPRSADMYFKLDDVTLDKLWISYENLSRRQSGERIIILECMFYLFSDRFKIAHLYRDSPSQICCWSLWRWSDSFYFAVSKSFGEFAVCKIETAFTVLLGAKSRSGCCPGFEDPVFALILKNTTNCNNADWTILNCFTIVEGGKQIEFFDLFS